MHVAVYGNLIYDRVLVVPSLQIGGSNTCTRTYQSAGGIANFCRALRRNKLLNLTGVSCVGNDIDGHKALAEMLNYCNELVIDHSIDQHTSAATIISEPNTRTGLVSWGACSSYTDWYPVPAADWHHIMYLDRLSITAEQLRNFPGVVSADFCDSNNIQHFRHLLRYVDYLIASESDVDRLYDLDLPVRKAIIVHSPGNCYIKEGDQLSEYSNQLETGLNVLGAGDYFAAYCIDNLLKNSILDFESIHSSVVTLLRERS